ncbi:MAG: trypsin-like peptidase domain-containing protein [Lachnospiraceae bacterium]|nr:trypsin-like peptidase domain-containing protein [Lachnospiraceae bacterium]
MSERTRQRQGLFVILVVFLLVIGLIRTDTALALLEPAPAETVSVPDGSEPAPDGTESVSVVLDTLPAFSDNPPAMEEAACSVVMLEVIGQDGSRLAMGSGFVAYDPAVILTCAHVITNMKYVNITGENGVAWRADTILAADRDKDIAILKISEEENIPPLSISGDKPLRGEKTVAIGSQKGVLNLVTLGNVCGSVRLEETDWILFTSPVSPGSSGGPLLNNKGQVIGMIIGSYSDTQNLNLAVSVTEINQLYRYAVPKGGES